MDRAAKLLQKLTLEEKARLLSGRDFWNTEELSRLELPAVCLTDGPHGLRKTTGGSHASLSEHIRSTCFPAACATACSFDPALLTRMGEAMGEECVQEGVAVLLGPGVNIKRSPLCGRNFEYFSEDPSLSGKLAAALIRGVESQNVGTSLKHFAVNNQEYCRMVSSSVVDERTMRELYLPAFETAVREGKPATVMGSYNLINGVYACENEELLQKILREEWGYDGVVVTDWGAVSDRIAALRAGTDLEMPGDCEENTRDIVAAVENGTLPEEIVDRAAQRVLRLILRGMENTPTPCDMDAHHALAGEIAAESAVLLQNNGVLPLSKTQTIAVIGKYAKVPRYQGAGSSQIDPTRVTSAVEAMEEAGISFTYAEGTGESREEALHIARKADVAVVFAALPYADESEGYDRKHLRLPKEQIDLIEAVAATGVKTVVVLSCGGVVELPFADKVDAILLTYLGGQNVGTAVKELLFGEKNPSGKLAETWGKRLADYASTPWFGQRNPQYREGLYVGYRWFDTVDSEVAYPFGFGLSYTSFAYSGLTVEHRGDAVEVTFAVKNTGSVFGKEIAQVYVKPPKRSDLYRPAHELKGFVKVPLSPGEEKTVTVTLTHRDFAVWYQGQWQVEKGDYTIEVGASSRDIRLQSVLSIDGISILESKNDALSCYFHPKAPFAVNDETFEALLGHPIPPEPPLRPFHRDSALIDLRECLLGKMAFGLFEWKPWLFAKNMGAGGADLSTASDFRRMVEGMVYQMPLRSIPTMGLGALSHRQVDGLVDLCNGKVFRGIHKLIRRKKK